MNKYDFKTSDFVVELISNNNLSFKLCSRKLTKDLMHIILKYAKSDRFLSYLEEYTNSEVIINILPNYELDAVITDIKDYCMENNLSLKIVNSKFY